MNVIVPLTVQVPIEVQETPAMRDLNPRQKAFVVAYCHGGLENASAAVRAAGYSSKPGSDRVQAHLLLAMPNIRAALLEYQKSLVMEFGTNAVETIKQIAASPGHKDQFKAAQWVATMNGMHVVTEKIVNQTVTTIGDVTQAVKEISKMSGISEEQLLGTVMKTAEAIEVEYEDIPELPDELKGIL